MTFPTTHPALATALAARDYTVPTAVQLAVLEAHTASRDLLVSAQTGSGKTVAFGLAMATTLLGDAERFEAAAEPLALIIAPTRELAMQVQRELAWLYAGTGARVISCVGGMDARAEARQLAQGAQIVVGTPGRLRDHLERNRLDLTKLRTAILDEADEMLDLGFREDLEFILDATPATRQTLLFSATMPREIETLAKSYQRDAVRIETARQNEQHADIEYSAIRVAPRDVENAVVNVLRFHEMRATLVFCATREAVKRMHARLVERGFAAVALSGELTQNERTQALLALRDGRARVLVATDVAARGLDLPDLALVIHADLPNDKETLLHRSGRTGRAGKKGLCTIVVPFNKRRKADILLNAARLRVHWGVAPSADAIRTRDQERFLADEIFTESPTELDQGLARTLQAARSADEIALALVRLQRTRLPEPEDLAEDTGPPRREDRVRSVVGRDRFAGPDGRPDTSGGDTSSRLERAPRSPRREREDARPMVWFRLNIGRERNADPRWLLPLICKAGGITKSEIGVIKIFDRDTRFQIVADLADQFADAVRSNTQKEGHISRVGTYSPDDDAVVAGAIGAMAQPARVPAAEPVVVAVSAAAAPAKPDARDTSMVASNAAPSGNSDAETPAAAPASAETVTPASKPFAKKPSGKRSYEKKSFDKKSYDSKKPYDGKKSFEGKKPFGESVASERGERTAGEGATADRGKADRPHWAKPRDAKPQDGNAHGSKDRDRGDSRAKDRAIKDWGTKDWGTKGGTKDWKAKPYREPSREKERDAKPEAGHGDRNGSRPQKFAAAKTADGGAQSAGAKPPWRDRTKPRTGGYQGRKRPDEVATAQATRADNRAETGGGQRERPNGPSKYAHKKKQRPAPSTAS